MTTPVDYVGGTKILAADVEENEAFLEAIAPPVGAIMPFAGSGDPPSPNVVANAKWLLADGRAISRVSYPDLFAAIGTTYGAGNGTTTFNIPDLRARVAAGADTFGTARGAAGIRNRNEVVGQSGGEEEHTLTVPEIPAHSHNFTIRNNGLSSDPTPLAGDTGSLTGSTANTGGGLAHENMPPFLSVNYIVRVR